MSEAEKEAREEAERRWPLSARYAPEDGYPRTGNINRYQGFIEGAAWQASRAPQPTEDDREALAREIHAAHQRRWCLNGDGEACPEARQIADAIAGDGMCAVHTDGSTT